MSKSLLDLPEEVLHHVLKHVEVKDQCAFACVSKKANEVARHPTLWKNVVLLPYSMPGRWLDFSTNVRRTTGVRLESRWITVPVVPEHRAELRDLQKEGKRIYPNDL